MTTISQQIDNYLSQLPTVEQVIASALFEQALELQHKALEQQGEVDPLCAALMSRAVTLALAAMEVKPDDYPVPEDIQVLLDINDRVSAQAVSH